MPTPLQKPQGDLLLSWKEFVREYKFKQGRPSDKVFTNAAETEAILRGFFNESDYIATKQSFDKDNYLVFLLTSKKETEIHLLNEMAVLIKYAQSSPHVFALKSSKDVIAHEELSGVLFEVYVNKFLDEKRLTLKPNSSYVNAQGENKPLDAFFEFEGSPYLVECYRPNDPSTKNLLRLSFVLLDHIVQKKLASYQVFIGHIAFTSVKDPVAVFKEATREVLRIFEAYLKAFESSETISIPAKYSAEQVSIEILPFHMALSHDSYFESNEAYEILTTFEIRPNPHNIERAELHLAGKRRVNPDAINARLFDKVKGKIKQHRDAPYNKIIFVEIDNSPGVNSNNPMFPLIEKKHLDKKRFEQLITLDVILVFVFKTVTERGGILRDNLFVYNPVHQPLVSLLATKLIPGFTAEHQRPLLAGLLPQHEVKLVQGYLGVTRPQRLLTGLQGIRGLLRLASPEKEAGKKPA